jgi:cytochrome c554/c'-like protein
MMPRCGANRPFLLRFVAISLLFTTCSSAPRLLRAQTATEDRLLFRGWWPRHSTPAADEYVGPAQCARCHPGKAATQKNTPMARTADLVADSDILASHTRLTFQAGKISYEVATSEDRNTYMVTDGTRRISAPLTWSFGDGHVGQSWLFEQDAKFYESRVSYFDALKALDFTPGRKLTDPQDLEQAMARPVLGSELVRCFACHTTASTINERFDRRRIIPGITCEACHGPGLSHAVAHEMAYLQGQTWQTGQEPDLIFDPGKLSPADAVDFCGACHGTWSDVKLGGLTGIANVRAQPYRLEKSRCWGKKGDARLTCVACHDPHRELVRDSASYDRNCLSCHLAANSNTPTSDHPGPPCKVSTKNCASCHMPKSEDSVMHYTFTDHYIRVVRPGAPYPD